MEILFAVLFTAMVLAIIGAKAFVVVKEGERAVVFRLGQLLSVSGPGRLMAFPFLDRVVRVSLDSIRGWETMPEDELKEKILEIAMSKLPGV